MKHTIRLIVYIFLLSLISISSASVPEIEADQALITIKVGVDLSQLERSGNEIALSIKSASQALQEMANNPNLEPQQQQQIADTFTQLNTLASSFEKTVSQLPTTIQQATPPISEAITSTLSQIQLIIILVLGAIVMLLIAALIAVYYWILKPSSQIFIRTTEKLDNMATALQMTANIVEKSTEQQLLILNSIEQKEK